MKPKLNRIISLLSLLVLVPLDLGASANNTIIVDVSRTKARAGDTVQVNVRILQHGPLLSKESICAAVLTPTVGTEERPLLAVAPKQGMYRIDIILEKQAPQGLYAVHVWIGDRTNPSAVGKATFLVGMIVADFFIASYVDSLKPGEDVEAYLQSFRQVGGNFLIAHNLITRHGAYYSSRIIKADAKRGSPNDLVELLLDQADKKGIAVMLSVSWDMTKNSHYKDRIKEIKSIADELFDLYRHHPSLVGFYSYQEGSGTYYAPFIREFSEHIKSLHHNLLTACAPHIDDPLLAGYLSTIEDLDIIIYQAGVMASYRTDNRKKYPHRRVRDVCGLGAGAKRLQNKIALNHVELFGYLEQRLDSHTVATSYENIVRQILSAATVTDADGISFFSYHAHVYNLLKLGPRVDQSRAAIADSVKAFTLITSQVSRQQNPIALYFPYSDWIIERWPNYFLPALDAFRVLGLPVDILPYAPSLEEAIYPYYPINMNGKVLERLLNERTVLLLSNVSGFQQTDSDLIEAFVESGGAVVAFGPQIPMGRSYDRTELFGIREDGENVNRYVSVRQAAGRRAPAGKQFSLSAGAFTRWSSVSSKVVATFDAGSPAVVVQRFGKGLTVSILTDALTAVRSFPDLVLDMIDEALKTSGHRRVADIHGLNENEDIAAVSTSSGGRIALVNHNTRDLKVEVTPLNVIEGGEIEWIDMGTSSIITVHGTDEKLEMTIPATSFRCLEYRPSLHRR